MRDRPTRIVSVGATPVNIRKTPSGANDVLAAPVTYAKIRYASGGPTMQLVPFSNSVYGDGEDVDAGGDYIDADQSINRYIVASAAGPTNVSITDAEA